MSYKGFVYTYHQCVTHESATETFHHTQFSTVTNKTLLHNIHIRYFNKLFPTSYVNEYNENSTSWHTTFGR